MEAHRKLSDSEFEMHFKQCEMSPAEFTHEAHLRLAWIHIDRYGIQLALRNIPVQLRNFVEAAGAQDKYNETLSVAGVKTMFHFMRKARNPNFNGLLQEFPRLKNNFKELIAAHYSFDNFNNQNAKEFFIEPDLLAYDIYEET